MSTYLLAFAVGMFDYVEAHDKYGVLHRAYVHKGLQEEARYALNISVQSLELLSDFFDIKYPLPKVDHVAVQIFMVRKQIIVAFLENAMNLMGCLVWSNGELGPGDLHPVMII